MSIIVSSNLTPRQIANRELKLTQATLQREAREAHRDGEHVGLAPDSDCTRCALWGSADLTFMGNAHSAESLERIRAEFTTMNRERVMLAAILSDDLEAFELMSAAIES